MTEEEKKNYLKEYGGLIAIVLVIVVAVLLVVYLPQKPEPQPATEKNLSATIREPKENIYDFEESEGGKNAQPPLKEEMLRAIGIDRNNYNLPVIPGYSYFGQLPDAPLDFPEYKIMYARGEITDIFKIPEAYYLQPEFLPSWENWLASYRQVEQSIGTFGTGFYQAEQWIQDLKAGDTIELSALLFAGAKIQYYQGISLDYTNKENFDVNIIPEETVLGRTYPEFERDPDWIQPIRFVVTAKPETEAGDYTVDITFKNVSAENRQKWKDKYRLLFVDRKQSPAGVTINLRFHIQITEKEQ